MTITRCFVNCSADPVKNRSIPNSVSFSAYSLNPPAWTDDAFTLPPLEEIILYELNVAEFGGDFEGVGDRTPVSRDGTIDWHSQENRPAFESLKELTHATYAASKNHPRFMPVANQASRIIQIAEDLMESAYQLSPIAASAVNGNWEKRLTDLAQHMAATNSLSPDVGKEILLSDERFDNQGYTGQKRAGSDNIPALA